MFFCNRILQVEFRVRVLGTPKPSIQWYKDDVEIFACDRIEMREEEEGGAVILKAARLSDSGVIKCVASNILGRCTSTAQFSIEGIRIRMKISDHEQKIYAVFEKSFCFNSCAKI